MKTLIILLLLTSCAKNNWDNGLGVAVVCNGNSAIAGLKC
jgi:hypothetical protein